MSAVPRCPSCHRPTTTDHFAWYSDPRGLCMTAPGAPQIACIVAELKWRRKLAETLKGTVRAIRNAKSPTVRDRHLNYLLAECENADRY